LSIGRFFVESLSVGDVLLSVLVYRRHLPHIHALDRPIFLTWRLAGTLPQGRYFPGTLTSGKAFVTFDRLLHEARSGPSYLRIPEIAKVVDDAIRYRDPSDYRLHAYVVMPNHVHMLVTPFDEVRKIMQSLKRFTAREANRVLGRSGTFWAEESYDRIVRDQREFERIADYIENNPVVAGLASTPEGYLYSSGRAD
jgi:REP element-mobilizing transposase RayT